MASYATPADLVKRYDWRTIGDLASDTGSQIAQGSIATDANVLACLADASGEIDSAVLSGGMYTATDLLALSGNGLAKLIRLTCQIAIVFLYERRPLLDPETAKAYREMNNDALERLRKGENVFDVAANIAAGLPSVDGPSTIDFNNLNLIRDRASKYYPARQLPGNR